MNTFLSILNDIATFFESLTEQERRENLVLFSEQAGRYAPVEGEHFDLQDVRKDKECIDTVGIFLRVDENQRVHFAVKLGPKVQTLTRAMATILCRGLNGAIAEEVLNVPREVVSRIVGVELTRRRSQTVYYVLYRMKEAVRQFLSGRHLASSETRQQLQPHLTVPVPDPQMTRS
jgi:cysteine desulfuration protein SufE